MYLQMNPQSTVKVCEARELDERLAVLAGYLYYILFSLFQKAMKMSVEHWSKNGMDWYYGDKIELVLNWNLF